MKVKFTPEFFYGVGIGLISISIVGSVVNATLFSQHDISIEVSINLLAVAFIFLIAGGIICASYQNNDFL